MLDHKSLVGSEEPFPFRSHGTQISQRITVGDICCDDTPRTDWVNEDGKKIKGKKSSWDTFSYTLMMNHNVEMMLKTLQEANRIYKVPASGNEGTGIKGIDSWIPKDLITFRDKILPEVFAAKTKKAAFAIIDSYKNELGGLGGQDAGKGLLMSAGDDDNIEMKEVEESVLQEIANGNTTDPKEMIAHNTDGFLV